MKKILLAVIVSTATPQVYWGIFGPLDVSTMTATTVGLSTGAISNVILHSATTPDCYQLMVQPNGTLTTKWVTCPK